MVKFSKKKQKKNASAQGEKIDKALWTAIKLSEAEVLWSIADRIVSSWLLIENPWK